MSIESVLKACEGIETKLKDHGVEQRVLADRILQLEQRSTKLDGSPAQGSMARANGLGLRAFEALQANADLLKKTGSVRLELKAAGDAITTTSGRTIISGGVGAPQGRVLGLQYGLPQVPASGTTALEYSRYTGMQGGAAQQATEGAAKASVRPDHSLITQTALTIAGFTKISKQAMNDRAQLVQAVEVTLMRSVDTSMDVALVNGATGFSGGFEGLATAYTSLVYTALVDAISEGVSTMQTAGFSPDVVALNPADWLAISVAKGSDGHYLSGAYMALLPMVLRTLRVVLSPSVDAGKALLLDTAHCELRVVDQFEVEAAYDQDDFTKNLITLRGETRVIPVFLTVGAARLITPKA